jgi:hypothetical protein
MYLCSRVHVNFDKEYNVRMHKGSRNFDKEYNIRMRKGSGNFDKE